MKVFLLKNKNLSCQPEVSSSTLRNKSSGHIPVLPLRLLHLNPNNRRGGRRASQETNWQEGQGGWFRCCSSALVQPHWAGNSNEQMHRVSIPNQVMRALIPTSAWGHMHPHFPLRKTCKYYFLHLAKAHLLFHYISDVALHPTYSLPAAYCVSVSGLWRGGKYTSGGKEASPKGRIALHRRDVIIFSN